MMNWGMISIAYLLSAGLVARAESIGFIYHDGNYTTFRVPNALLTNPYGINDEGQIVGSYVNSFGEHGFLYSGGTYSTLDAPGNPPYTIAYGINDVGQIVGAAGQSPFLYSGGSYTFLPVPGGIPTGINDAGLIVGGITGSGTPGFLLSGTSYTTISVPNAFATFAYSINNKGMIVGTYFDLKAPFYQGFLFSNGNYTTIDVPAPGNQTQLLGINDAGQIVGFSAGRPGTGPTFSFLYQGGTYTVLAMPDFVLSVRGINNAGDVVGVADVVVSEPGTNALLTVALGVLLAMNRRRGGWPWHSANVTRAANHARAASMRNDAGLTY